MDQLSNEHAAPSSDPVFDTDCRRPIGASAQLASNTIELAWDTFQRALELDLAENTAATSTLRFMSYQAWRELYLADGVSR